LPEGIDEERSRPRYGDLATWVRRGVLVALAVFVAAALLNVFGQRPTVSRADSSAAEVTVTAPAALRGGLIFQVKVQIDAHQALARPALLFSGGWFDSMSTNAVVPQPADQTSRDGRPVFDLAPIGAGRSATYWFYFQVNPSNVGWRRPETLQLLENGAAVAEVRRTITIYP
jgi:hypothetical protein